MNNLNHLSEQELVQLYLKGNTEALSNLVSRYKDRIYTAIFLLVKDKYLAEDLFQDVFIRVIDSLKAKGYSNEWNFLPWALSIAHNLCVDHFRKIKRTPSITISDDRDIFEVLNFSEPNAETRLIQSQLHERVRKMIDLLPEDQREVIILRHYADLSFKEIASITKCSTNTALGRMRYGLINMRKMTLEKKIAF